MKNSVGIPKKLFFIFIFILLTACNTNALDVEDVTERTLDIGVTIPEPTGEVILQVVTLTGDTINFDQILFGQMGTVAYTVNDPWLQEDVNYTGVLLTDLLNILGSEDATEIQLVALDGYNAGIPATIFNEHPLLIAYQANGELLDVANNGPTRIIFPYDQYPDITEARNLSVWNLERIEIK